MHGYCYGCLEMYICVHMYLIYVHAYMPIQGLKQKLLCPLATYTSIVEHLTSRLDIFDIILLLRIHGIRS